ncbi:MAG: lipopolysaccharide heptosyltransferase family protein [Alphaproteobacteria bacterium]|nr:lipopolysaccharide heptosyltransferase family protein [Alphaproteobacteria bacterium]
MAGRAPRQHILVVKHGALGDFILAMAPFAAIRAQHKDATITLLTTLPFAALAASSPYFDDVWVDERPPFWSFATIFALRRRLRDGDFTRVYDLQTSRRSSMYFHLFAYPKPEWSGMARGCSHPHRNASRDTMHTLERQRDQLREAGIPEVPAPDLNWLDGDLSGFALPSRFALIVPGGAPHRPAKRWPPTAYAALITRLATLGLGAVLLGGAADRAAIGAIREIAPAAIDLCGRTSIGQIAALARRSAITVGNDTGPMHLIAALDCPSIVLFSRASDPTLSAPRGPAVQIIAVDDLATLTPDTVSAAITQS